MDTTPKYIEMCRKATEIQLSWEPANGDFFAYDIVYIVGNYRDDNQQTVRYDGDEFSQFKECYELIESDICIKEDAIWLPRQDQLQGMLEWTRNGEFGILLIDAFYEFAKSYNPIPFSDDSMTWEQLWLAFVMKKNFSKVWNGENWITLEG